MWQAITQSAFKKLLRTTDKYITILCENWFQQPQNLLRYFPRTYEDRRNIKPISHLLGDGSTEVTKAKIAKKWMIRTPTWKLLIEVIGYDEEEQEVRISVLNNRFFLKKIQTWKRYYIVWKLQKETWKNLFRHPDVFEATETTHMQWQVGCIYPIYSDLAWIKAARFSKKIPPLVDQLLEDIHEQYPAWLYKQYNLLPTKTMLKALHVPETIEETKHAKKTLFFKRMLRVQLQSLLSKKEYQWSIHHQQKTIDRDILKEFLKTLSFTLTSAQKRSLKEIIEHMHEPQPMLRMLQWDVWSWKTVVAAAAAWYCIKKFWWQVAFLAPLEVLAQQHHKTLAALFLPLWVRIFLLTGSTKPKEKLLIKDRLKNWVCDIIVWTHALLQDDVHFDGLWLAIIDEQHKFGVRQRAQLQRHGSPHLLQMTATPIPRSMALAFFGEFSISTIDQLPVWRKKIHTKIITEKEFLALKPWILTKIQQWQKVFLITPLIEESEMLESVKAATAHFEELQTTYQEIKEQIWLLHWKMKPVEKETIMGKFKQWTYTMLVSTTVIEVGIDIPEATIMIIYNAERFGLSQLHQLRGRVWRSSLQSYCFLQTPKKSGESYKRLKHMESTNDWFALSEIDLQFRWPWEFLWVRQSWETDIPLEILGDTTMLQDVHEAAQWLLQTHQKTAHKLVSDLWEQSLLV